MAKKTLPIILFFVIFIIACKESVEPKETKGNITGTVKDLQSGEAITEEEASIFLGNNLLATTNENGVYSISSLEEGTYELTCSIESEFFNEETNTVQITGGKTTTHDFYVEHLGKLYGEFQDFTLFNDAVVADSQVAKWDARTIYEGTTGATLIGKYVLANVAQCEIYSGDTVLIYVDAWAQYVKMLPVGNYTLQGSCAGAENLKYVDEIKDIEIFPDSIHYVNFFLSRQASAKLVVK
jgi:hypothetical protein